MSASSDSAWLVKEMLHQVYCSATRRRRKREDEEENEKQERGERKDGRGMTEKERGREGGCFCFEEKKVNKCKNGVNRRKKKRLRKRRKEGPSGIGEKYKHGGGTTETRENIEASFRHRTPEKSDKSQLAAGCRLNLSLSPWF